MRIPNRVLRRLQRRTFKVPYLRAPDEFIGGTADVYMKRWFLIPKNRWFNVMLHNFRRSDDDRAHHDHPWCNVSLLLDGTYIEHVGDKKHMRQQGHLYFRSAKAAHRVELIRDQDGEMPVWTLFITGPKTREWGFHCGGKTGWRHNKEFCAPGEVNRTVGRGCD